jgi:hypothetical protein
MITIELLNREEIAERPNRMTVLFMRNNKWIDTVCIPFQKVGCSYSFIDGKWTNVACGVFSLPVIQAEGHVRTLLYFINKQVIKN